MSRLQCREEDLNRTSSEMCREPRRLEFAGQGTGEKEGAESSGDGQGPQVFDALRSLAEY